MIKRKIKLIFFIINFSLSFILISNNYIFAKISTEEQDTWYRVYKMMGGADLKTDTFGNIFVVGTSYSKAKLLKFNATGDLLFNQTWEGQSVYAKVIAIDSQNKILVAGYGYLNSSEKRDVFLLKYNNTGVLQWNRSWGGEEMDYARAIAVDSNNNIYITGYTNSFGGYWDPFLIKYDANGTFLWQNIWGTSESERGNSIAIDSNDDVYIGVDFINFSITPPNQQLSLLKYNSTGKLLWNITVPGGSPPFDLFMITSDEIYTVVRYCSGNNCGISIMKYNNTGNKIWESYISLISYTDIALDSLEFIYLCGRTRGSLSDYDLYLCKLDHSGSIDYEITCGGGGYDDCKGLTIDLNDNIYLLGNSYDKDGISYLVLIKNPVDGLRYFDSYLSVKNYNLFLFVALMLSFSLIMIFRHRKALKIMK